VLRPLLAAATIPAVVQVNGSARGARSQAAMQERRERILDAAVQLFNERGYQGATTDDIADAAHVTKRTLYRHVGSKEHLLLEIHTNFINEGLRRWQAIVDRGGTPTEVLTNLIHEHVRSVAEFQKAISVFFEEMKHLDSADRAEIINQRDRYESILHETLKAGMRSGEFRRMDPKVSTLVILGCLTEIYRWYRPSGPLGVQKLSDFLIHSILEGVRA
jgi:AcrR family transcriptional regulator